MNKSVSLFLLGLTIVGVQSVSAQNISSANIYNQSAEAKAAAVNVTLTGTINTGNNGDFRQLRDLCYQLKSLNLSQATCPDIPRNAMHSRHNLETLKLPGKVQTIGTQAFFACDALKGTIFIPSSITNIGASAFSMCKSIQTLKFGTLCSLNNIGSYAFKGCESLEGTVVIPNKVVVLRDGVFEGCVKLQGVQLPVNLQSIGTNTFSNCKALNGEIKMGRMLTRIGGSAFADCSALESVTMPRALQSLGDAAFMNCSSLKGTISIPGSIQYLGKGAFYGCSALEAVVLPDGLKSVQAATFAGCTGLKSVTVYSQVPPVAEPTAFAGVNCSAITLFVPDGSEQAYREAAVWKDFDIKTATAITDIEASAGVEVEVEGSQLWVKNMPAGSKAQLVDAQGRLIATVRGQGETCFDVPCGGVYIVIVNGRSIKVKC